jgi:hypothetical protein
MEQYRGHLYYKLYRALQNEGIDESDMVFDKEMTFVSDLGFFTIRHEQEIPELVHFLVWPEKRVWHNSIRFYRMVKAALIDLGFSSFIASMQDGDKKWPVFFKLWGDKNKEPYATVGKKKYFLLSIRRHIR